MTITKISAAMTDLDGAVTINESSADADFRVESDGNANMLFVDGGNDRVGVGTSPDYTMHIFTSDSGASAHGNSDDLFIENSGNAGITIGSGTTSNGSIFFSDSDSSLSGQIEYRHNGDSLYIYTGAASRLRIDSDGLKFGNDTASANALDDYEEGTWSVDLTGCDDNLSSPTGHYTKIGRLVYVYWYSGSFTVSNASGTAFIGGLPFTVRSNSGQAYSTFQYLHGDAVDGNTTGGYFDHAATTMRFIDAGSTGGSTYVNGSRYIMISGVYETDS